MVNLLRLCSKMTHDYMTRDALDSIVDFEYFKKFAERNNFLLIDGKTSEGRGYMLKRNRIQTCFLDNYQDSHFCWLDIADTHFGNSLFSEKLLRIKLEQAIKEGIKNVFVAGDVFEGIRGDSSKVTLEEALDIQENQVELAFSIFKDYNLNYYVINGNHDYTFELLGLHNPIDLLANRLRQRVPDLNFNYYDTYTVDFIISGFCKRVTHIERYIDSRYTICAVDRFKSYTPEELHVEYKGIVYPIRFFTCGHTHVTMDLFYSPSRIYISQPGSFMTDSNISESGIIVKGKATKKKIIRYI